MSDYGKSKKTINHVRCDAENCIHNNHDCCCTASEIRVGTQNASNSWETICESFASKQ